MRAAACETAFVLSSGYFFSRRLQRSDFLRTLADISLHSLARMIEFEITE
jgi:hypothetical protein